MHPPSSGTAASTPAAERNLRGAPEPVAGRRRLERRLVVALAVLAGTIIVTAAVAAYGVAALAPSTYGARAELVYQLESGTDRDAAARQLATQVITIRSRAVLEPVAAEEGLRVEDLAKDVDASIVADSAVVQITVEADSRDVALRRVVAVAQQYTEAATAPVSEPSEKLITDRIAALTTRLGEIQQALAEFDEARAAAVRQRLPEPVPTAEERSLQVESDQVVQELGLLRQQLLVIQAERLSASQPRLLTPPYGLEDPLSPRPAASAALGAMVGMAIATVVVLVLARRELRQSA